MTKDEMAEEYAKGLCKTCKVDVCRHSTIQTCAIKESLKQAHLAGLKAGKDMAEADLATVAYMQGAERYKPKWHKVADGDYPPCEKGNYTINVLTDCGDIAYYNYSLDCWIVEPSSAEIDPPKAWCEIPKFEE